MKVAELSEKTKELQMMHVTRDFSSVFRADKKTSKSPSSSSGSGSGSGRTKGGGEAAHEVATLEALAKQREVLHAKV